MLWLSLCLAQDSSWGPTEWDAWFSELDMTATHVDQASSATVRLAVELTEQSAVVSPEQVAMLDRAADDLVDAADEMADELKEGADVLNGLQEGDSLINAHSTELGHVAEAAVGAYTNASVAYATVTLVRLDVGGELGAARKQIAYTMEYGDYIVVDDTLFELGYLVLVDAQDPMALEAELWCSMNCEDPSSVLASGNADVGDEGGVETTSLSQWSYHFVDTAGGVHQLHIDSYAFTGKTLGVEFGLNYHRGFGFKSNGFKVYGGPALRFAGVRLAAGGIFDGYGKSGGDDYNLPAAGGAYLHAGGRWAGKRLEVLGNVEPHFYRKDRANTELSFGDELTAEAGFGVKLGPGFVRLTGQRMMVAPGTYNAYTVGYVSYL
jgi:hypothetical protein